MAAATTEPLSIDLYTRQAHSKQREFHEQCRSGKEVHFVAGRQSGKTEAGAAEAFVQAVITKPGGEFLFAGPTYDKTVALRRRFEHFCPAELRHFHATERRFDVRSQNGQTSTIYVRNTDEDTPRGMTLDAAWIDEAAFAPEEFYHNLYPALAVKGGRMFTTTTPKGQNSHYRMYTGATASGVAVFCESRDNPGFPDEEWQRAIDRHGFDSAYFQQEYRAVAAAFLGQAVPQFASRALIKPANWNPSWQAVVGMDFGWSAGTSALLCQISPDEDIIIHGLRYWTETPRHEITADLNWQFCDRTVPSYAIDPAGTSARAPESSDIGWQTALEDMARAANGSTMIEVRFNRRIGESASLNMIRELAQQGKIIISDKAVTQVHGGIHSGPDEVHRILAGAELSKNVERDELADHHPYADVMDALRYVVVNTMPHLQRRAPVVSRHAG